MLSVNNNRRLIRTLRSSSDGEIFMAAKISFLWIVWLLAVIAAPAYSATLHLVTETFV